jgi:Trypsin-like peptidase domain
VLATNPGSQGVRRGVRCLLCALLAGTWLLTSLGYASADNTFDSLPDFPVPNGHFYSQASGQGGADGFALVDDASARMFSEFDRLGSADKLGYPASQRFTFGGFVTQATQRELLQWRPETGRVAMVNVFDLMTQRGLDPLLAQTRLIPPTEDNSADARLPWAQIVARHLALLDRNPAIKARYFADPNPIADFGLPQGTGDFGGVYVVRCERAAFQQWRIATYFAQPGEVTQVNAGDLAKEVGIVPAAATVPVPAASQLVAPPGVVPVVDVATQAQAHKSAAVANPSLVRIDVRRANGSALASGIVLDQAGDILTNEHVIDSALAVAVTLPSGTVTAARVVGIDVRDDLAVIKISPAPTGPGLVPATFVGGGRLVAGQFLVALGYSPYFPSPPAIRLGIFQRRLSDSVTLLRSDTFILPGDSGGMLLDLSGNVVGINDEIRLTDQSQQPLVGYSIDASDAYRIAQQLIQSSTRPPDGVTPG